jgi:hypothetical protein
MTDKLKAKRKSTQTLGNQRKLEMIHMIWKCGNLTCRQVMEHVLFASESEFRVKWNLARAMLNRAVAGGLLIARTDEVGRMYYFLALAGARFLLESGVNVKLRSGKEQNINVHRSISNTYALRFMRHSLNVDTFTDADVWGHSFIAGGADRVPWVSWAQLLNKKPDVLGVFDFGRKNLTAIWVEIENCHRSDKDLATLVGWIRAALVPAHPMELYVKDGRVVELGKLCIVTTKSTAHDIARRIERSLIHPPHPRNRDGTIDYDMTPRLPLTHDELMRVSDRISFVENITQVAVAGLPSLR